MTDSTKSYEVPCISSVAGKCYVYNSAHPATVTGIVMEHNS